jgi:hypothetical protein
MSAESVEETEERAEAPPRKSAPRRGEPAARRGQRDGARRATARSATALVKRAATVSIRATCPPFSPGPSEPEQLGPGRVIDEGKLDA